LAEYTYDQHALELSVLPGARIAGHVFRPPDPVGRWQVLVHGGTYDHRYWDAPAVGAVRYSYAREMVGRGYSVLAIDQLGAGASARPPGDQVSLEVAAAGLAEVIAQLRGGAIGPCDSVALVGHSIGTIVSVRAQATFRPADVLVATGLVHEPVTRPPFPPGVIEAAMQSEYVELPDHARAGAFYDQRAADPAMIELDNATLRQPIARALLADAFAAVGDEAVSGVAEVTGPVLVQLSDRDVMAPADLAGGEERHWRGSTDVTVEIVPGLGHCFNLHRGNKASWDGIDRYLGSRLEG
jgi:pimeloyl-ACP methyl ester carboxylesterase